MLVAINRRHLVNSDIKAMKYGLFLVAVLAVAMTAEARATGKFERKFDLRTLLRDLLKERDWDDSGYGDPSWASGYSGDESGYPSGAPYHSGDASGYPSGAPHHSGDESGYPSWAPHHFGDESGYPSWAPHHSGDESGYPSGAPYHFGDESGYPSGAPHHFGDESGYSGGESGYPSWAPYPEARAAQKFERKVDLRTLLRELLKERGMDASGYGDSGDESGYPSGAPYQHSAFGDYEFLEESCECYKTFKANGGSNDFWDVACDHVAKFGNRTNVMENVFEKLEARYPDFSSLVHCAAAEAESHSFPGIDCEVEDKRQNGEAGELDCDTILAGHEDTMNKVYVYLDVFKDEVKLIEIGMDLNDDSDENK